MMQLLTPHFAREEFELDGPMPEECVAMYTVLCHMLLETIRTHFVEPINITSGYRSPSENEEAHGVKNSQHVASANWCAADFRFEGAQDMRPIFDWLRQQTNLVWDQTILEHDPPAGRDIVHLSLTRGTNRREALEGYTANMSPYTSWPVAAFSVKA